jgi:hypothetical protein
MSSAASDPPPLQVEAGVDGRGAVLRLARRRRSGRKRSWLVVERLPAYAPELNPVEALWANLKVVELASLAGDTSTTSLLRPSVASNGSAIPTTWPPRSCGTAACPCGEWPPCHRNKRGSSETLLSFRSIE